MSAFSRWIIRHAALILLVSLILSGFGIFYSAKLYTNLRTDLEELLPSQARAVLDMNEVTSRLESIDNLSVLVFSEDTKASKRFVLDFVKKLESVPKNTIASVEYNIANELRFFERRRALYIDLPDLIKIRNYIRDRITYEEVLYNPLTIFAGVNYREPTLDLMAIRNKYEGKVSTYSRFPEGFYATPDGKKRVVLVYMPGKTSGVGNVHKLKKAVVDAITELNPKSYAPDLEIQYSGGVQNTIEEQSALVADLELSTIIVMILCTGAMIIFFRAVRASIALLIALLAGTFWTFGVSYFAVGYLNANSAFLGSIIIGNGINFPIILLARYLEERRNLLAHDKALDIAVTHTASATWTAALAAGLSYGSLALTSFRGFKQFGIIGLIGMVLCWISAFTVLPALLTVLEKWKSLKPRGLLAKSYVAEGIARFVSRFPKQITLATILLSVVSGLTVFKYSKKIIETDLSKLRNKTSMESGSGYLSKHVDEIFQRYLSPMVVLPKSRDDARIMAEKYRELKKKQGENSLIANVSTLDDFIPENQDKKIQVIREIHALLPVSIRSKMPLTERKLAEDFLTPESLTPIKEENLPKLVITKFTERDGSIGKLVLVEPPIGSATWDGDNLISFIRDLRRIADETAPGTPVAGSLPISSDMIESISIDGPKATLFAFLAVVILVIILFRRFSVFGPVLLALGLGVLWLGGFILGAWYKINFLNFIALPITFGIGVDYAVNIFSRYREEGDASILKVIRDTGGAVMLCSFTTTVGWGSLLIAENQAFVSFGTLAVVGEITCILAAMISLPAILLSRKPRKVGNRYEF